MTLLGSKFSTFLPVIIALALPVIYSNSVLAQESSFGPCSLPADWSQIRVKESGAPASPVRILIATNRTYVPDAADGVIFPNELSEFRKMNYLLASCEEGAWQLYQVDDLRSGLNNIDNGNDILVFVHGHGKSLPLVLTRSNQISKKYGVSLIVFDWPSNNFNFNKSLSRVRRCGENFYNLVLQLKSYRRNEMESGQGLSMLLHSLGNYYLTHLVVNGNNQYLDEKIFDNIIMNAAAVRSTDHGDVLSQLNIQDRLFVVMNKRDKVLKGAELLTFWKMLGNHAPEPLAENATYVDFSEVAGTEHTYFAGYHEFENTVPGVKDFFKGAFHGREPNFSNRALYKSNTGKEIFEVIDPFPDEE